MAVCMTCDEQRDAAYDRLIARKVSAFFEANPCVDCGETDPALLDFTPFSVKIRQMIAEQTPWVQINRVVSQSGSICVSCVRRRIAARGDPWWLMST